jgi:hypothetical protein
VNAGVVLLSGEAATLSDHQRALERAREVAGVRKVSSEIRSPDQMSDRELWAEDVVASDANSRRTSTSRRTRSSGSWQAGRPGPRHQRGHLRRRRALFRHVSARLRSGRSRGPEGELDGRGHGPGGSGGAPGDRGGDDDRFAAPWRSRSRSDQPATRDRRRGAERGRAAHGEGGEPRRSLVAVTTAARSKACAPSRTICASSAPGP